MPSANPVISMHVRALRHIRSTISEEMTKMVVCKVVGSRLNYANSVAFGTTHKNISQLQKAQNLIARVVLHVLLNPAVHVISSNTSNGFPFTTHQLQT